jgi:hypothetical protein
MLNMRDEYRKCFQDKTGQYFIEHYLSTFNADVVKETPFILFPRQICFLKSLRDNSNTIAIKHRQAGITTVSSGWATYKCVFADKKAPETILCIGNKLDTSQQLIEKMGVFLDQVPRWMWGSDFYHPDPDNEKNKKSIFVARNKQKLELFNGCKIYARSSGKHAARGISAVSILIFDEAAMIENGPEVYSQAVACTATLGSKARIIMISTPKGKDQLYYKTYDKALKGENNYTPIEFKWFQDPRYNRSLEWHRKNEKSGEDEVFKEPTIGTRGEIEYNEEHWRSMERDGWKPTSPWYITMCATFNQDQMLIDQELNVSFLGSSDNVVPVDTIEAQRDQNNIEITENWPFSDPMVKETWIWKPPIEGHRYITACLPRGESVLTNNGLKKIEDVTIEDKLVNKNGMFVRINTIKSRFVEDETIVDLKLSNMYDSVKFTWNHPIWSSTNTEIIRPQNKSRIRLFNFTFNKALELKPNDWIEIPNTYRNKTLSNNAILEHWAMYEKLGRSDYRINNPLLDEDFWWYCGMWLAEGWTYKTKRNTTLISTAHNKNEADILNKIQLIAHRLFNRTAICRCNKYNNCATLMFNQKQIAKFLYDNFGKYAKNKHISEWIKFLPEKLKYNLIKGYFEGDGCLTHNNVYMVSISKQLLSDIQDILFSIGIVSALFLSKKEHFEYIDGRKKICHCNEKYTLNCGKIDSKKLLDKIGVDNNIAICISRRPITYCYFSDDLSKIYVKIKEKKVYKYTGNVYNFDCETHTFCGNKIATHNCDNSSGSAEDFTAIQILDVDAIDEETNTPYIDQVLEYNGKITGELAAQLINQYAHTYNDALVVVEDIGGYGSATILALLEMKYPNLYYDDPGLKTPTIMKKYVDYKISKDGKLPGFHTSNVRFQMIAKFVELLKNNGLRIRSRRVINELETWVFKNGRPDHMDGFHDDLLTCLSMAVYVMEFSLLRNELQKKKDSAMLGAWFMNNKKYEDTYTHKMEDTVYASRDTRMKFNPFTTRKNADEKKVLNGCIMLGGFSIKK